MWTAAKSIYSPILGLLPKSWAKTAHDGIARLSCASTRTFLMVCFGKSKSLSDFLADRMRRHCLEGKNE